MARAGPSRSSQSETRVLLVEGQDDKHVVEHVHWRRFESAPSFHVVDKGGYERLCDALVPELKAPGREVVGIIVDANDDAAARWAAVTDRLRDRRSRAPRDSDRLRAPGRHLAVARQRVQRRDRGLRCQNDPPRRSDLADVQTLHQGHSRGAAAVLRGKDGASRGPCLARDESGAEAHGHRRPRGRPRYRWNTRRAIRKLAR